MTIQDAFLSVQSHEGELQITLDEIKASRSVRELLVSSRKAFVKLSFKANPAEVFDAVLLKMATIAFEAGRRYGRAEAKEERAKWAAQ